MIHKTTMIILQTFISQNSKRNNALESSAVGEFVIGCYEAQQLFEIIDLVGRIKTVMKREKIKSWSFKYLYDKDDDIEYVHPMKVMWLDETRNKSYSNHKYYSDNDEYDDDLHNLVHTLNITSLNDPQELIKKLGTVTSQNVDQLLKKILNAQQLEMLVVLENSLQ